MAVMPRLQMSAFSLYPSADWITSGAIQNGVPVDQGPGFWVLGSGFRVASLGFRVHATSRSPSPATSLFAHTVYRCTRTHF